MSVHLPLSREAVREATDLMLSTNNVFSPADGKPIITPTQDIVLGTYYLTYRSPDDVKTEDIVRFPNLETVHLALGEGKITLHDLIRVPMDRPVKGDDEGPANRQIVTTAGRIIFNEILDTRMSYYNVLMGKKPLNNLISDSYDVCGINATVDVLDRIKEIGFKFATHSGLSFGYIDLVVETTKGDVLGVADKEVMSITKKYNKGVMTNGERYNAVIDIWTKANQDISDSLMGALKDDHRDGERYLNPVYVMAHSGARGSPAQIRQLAGMRGLMSKPNGDVIEAPIKASFREGLTTREYFSSTHGARKGLADTALKTAESGYLTRKLVEVGQDVIIFEEDCGTIHGVTKETIYKGDKVEVPLADIIVGRVARDNIVDLITSEVIVRENEIITQESADKIEQIHEKIRLRSPLTCASKFGICQKCYGMDRSKGAMVKKGTAVGIIAAQSIGEPGTQLTMRTFHLGGTASLSVQSSSIRCKNAGFVKYRGVKHVKNEDGEILALNRNGEMLIVDEKGRELEAHPVTFGAQLFLKDGDPAKASEILMKWEPNFSPIITEVEGKVLFEGIEEDVTYKLEVDPGTGLRHKVITEHKGNLHPQIILQDAEGNNLGIYPIPEKAILDVEDGAIIKTGAILAKTPRAAQKTMDITGGIPRITELLEVRKPKEPAIMTEVSGTVEIGGKKRGKRVVTVTTPSGEALDYLAPLGKHLRVQTGDDVRAGDPLVEGSVNLQELLNIRGIEHVQTHILNEIQNVYRYQDVSIDDKHFEIIISRMFKKVQIAEFGDADFLTDIVDRNKFEDKNVELIDAGKRPATANQILMGITKAGLMADSFIAASSFQETTKVLTEAAIAGKKDNLLGLKENVILGHKIPAGTGYKEGEKEVEQEAESFFALM
jgi:DNA-directed RNA polymerase subunit beta'